MRAFMSRAFVVESMVSGAMAVATLSITSSAGSLDLGAADLELDLWRDFLRLELVAGVLDLDLLLEVSCL